MLKVKNQPTNKKPNWPIDKGPIKTFCINFYREYHHEIYVLFRERILFARLKILCPQNFLRPLSNVLGRAHEDQMRIVLSQQQACFSKWPLLKFYAAGTVTKILGLFALDCDLHFIYLWDKEALQELNSRPFLGASTDETIFLVSVRYMIKRLFASVSLKVVDSYQ